MKFKECIVIHLECLITAAFGNPVVPEVKMYKSLSVN